MSLFRTEKAAEFYQEMSALALTAKNEADCIAQTLPKADRPAHLMAAVSQWFDNKCKALEAAHRIDRNEFFTSNGVVGYHDEGGDQ